MPARPLQGQRVGVVSGTGGMGHAIARRAAEAGAEVQVVGRDLGRAIDAARQVGPTARSSTLDVTDESAIRRFFGELGAVNHLVVTAAQVRSAPFLDGAVADARFSFDGKFWSQYLCARHAQVSRSILLFSGILSRRPLPEAASIAAVNGAVEALGRALAVELTPVRVNVVSPGLVRGANYAERMGHEAAEAMYEATAAKLPARLVGDVDAVAIVAKAALDIRYLTGAVLDVDGGGLLA